MDAKQVWRAALGELQVSLSPANYETWLRDTQLLDVDEQRFRIAVPNGFAKDWLESRYRSLISQTLARIVGYSVQVEFVIGSTPDLPVEAEVGEVRERAHGPASPSPQVRVDATRVGGEGGTTFLNPRYTFSNFIVGSANRLAHAASLSVAERPGHAYNPLFLYGGVGLGKTHLMHAIGNAVSVKFPRKRILYATSEKFTNDFINSIREQRMEDFRNRYRRIDVLLIDDIQFIAERERTQEEFFHTFNTIHEAGKQIVLSSDRPPKAITTLEERLRSRFEWGLIADLTPPDLETRIAILRSKAEDQLNLIPAEVIEFIARKVVSNVRELEGALNRVVAYASMSGMPINNELASAVLSNVMYNPKKRSITPQRIVRAVADYYGVNLDQLRSSKRDKAIVVPRQIAMYLIREETDISLLRIGAELGGRDHSTVLHAYDKIARELAENDEMRREVSAVREMIYSE
jgi:chromosomal replication initiator protein